MPPTKSHFCLGLCHRLRHVLWRAPLSIFDFWCSLIHMGIGLHLLFLPLTFGCCYATLHRPMLNYVDQTHWGWIYLMLGGSAFAVTLWPKRPRFIIRLLARMGLAFGFLVFSLNNLSQQPPPVSTTVYVVLALASLWSVIRLKCDG